MEGNVYRECVSFRRSDKYRMSLKTLLKYYREVLDCSTRKTMRRRYETVRAIKKQYCV